MNLRSAVLSLLLFPAIASAGADKEVNLHPKPPEPVPAAKLEAAIDKGVDFLVSTQNKEGSWGGPELRGGIDIYACLESNLGLKVAVSAMCVSALIESGRESEKVLKTIERGEDFLFENLP